MLKTADLKWIKRLVQLVIAAGKEGPAQIKPALEKILSNRPASQRKQFLQTFQRILRREIAKDTLTVESAQPLQPAVLAQLVEHFGKQHPRALHVVEADNPELIAGMRIRLGDTVYDASLKGQLEELSQRIR